MRTRTRLTTPPDRTPGDDDRASGAGEQYVPAPDLAHEPRVPGRHRRTVVILLLVLTTLLVVATMVLLGAEAQREDPSVPGGSDPAEPEDAPDDLELPES